MRAGELNPWWRVGLLLFTPLVRVLFRVRVTGLEHVPSSGPAILAFNHVSSLDGPVLGIEVGWRSRRQTRFLVAAEFFAKRRFSWILRNYEQIPIRRGEGDADALGQAIDTVRHGALTAVSPEGRVNDDPSGDLQRIRSGVARIALPTGAPIVPVGIWGTQRRWPRTGLRLGRPRRPRLGLAFGPPILPVGSGEDPDAVDDLTRRLDERLRDQVVRARALASDPS